ncbi:MAG TPA: 3-mercaptopyruvate sulfurtransferase [Terricaulis sp.]|nr:3-mercaptopyruvate sulfurtransferase [Terricaulis sp.]
MTSPSDPVVSPAWLAERLDAPDIRVIDASWFMPSDPRNGKVLYDERRIPGAIFFDIDAVADKSSDLPHMLPSPEQFASQMRKLGVGDGMRLMIYDSAGIFSAPRVWWSFRAMGHEDVVVLDGGFPAWEAAGYPIETGPPQRRGERPFSARLRSDLVRDLGDMRRIAEAGGAAILDARPAARFRGETPEPRPGLRSGHIPGSQSLPAPLLLDEQGRLRSRDELEKVFTDAGIPLSRAPACTCGSGVAAAIVALALARLGRWDAAVYDGSWTEWGAQADTPVTTGA